ncbi:hypothetical protein J8631_01430 [Serratia fonticola]|uniref:hypothetical protein n=1 Tax=Serratia TaxID=613 RepID=UPI001AE4EB92|nr:MULTISPECIES: hypothetical protein [Serratia]MBP1034213.1 hypothetical protein [Serratia fonticola]UAN52196.1 hypothetical protein KGP26_03700 [Serratia sp. JSRIV002]UAN52895.1 hypothetical protein KGP26_07485 [Serratia sp. JSRIV002]
MKPATQKILGVNVYPLIAMLQQARRWWKIRELKRLWWEDMSYRKICKKRGWVSNLEWMNTESRYRLIKLYARAGKERGHL